MEVYRQIAREIKKKLDEGNYSFITLPYEEISRMYREVAGDQCRLAKTAREGITEALSDVGVKVFPDITDDAEAVRFFRSATILWNVVSNLKYPDQTSDRELAVLLNKVKTDSTVVFVFPPSAT